MEKKNNAAKTVSVIMLITLLGKVMGLVRDMLLGHNFATGMASVAFLTASRIPRNFFDAIFAAAISASFIPVFNEYLEKKGREEAFRLANAFITVTTIAAAALSALGMAFAPQLTALLADGFDAPTAALCTSLLRVLFPTVLFTGIAFSLVGILQSMDEFNVPAALSVVSNGVIIVYFAFFCGRFGIAGLAVAFLLGWAMQVLVQLPALHRKGYSYRPTLRHEGLGKIFALMLPVMASTWVQPLNLTVATKYASHLNGGAAAAAMEYANTLYTIVAGVFVLSIANVIFPEMSRMSARGEGEELDQKLRTTLSAMLFFLVPMSVGLASIAKPLVRLLYEWKAWTAESTQLTATALVFLSLGMLGYGIQMIVSRAFYAAQQGKVPLVAGLVSVGCNIALCAVLSPRFGIAGLAAASAVSAVVPAVVLLAAFLRQGHKLIDRRSVLDFGNMLHSAAAMLVVVFAVRYVGERFLGDGLVSRVLLVGVPAAAGAVVYFVMAFLLRISVLEKPAAMLRSKLGGDLLRSSLIIGSLIFVWERLAAWYFNSCIYRLWVRVSCTLAGLMDESLIVGFFRADWDSKVAFLTRPVVRGLARIQGFFAGEGGFALRCRESVVLSLLDERCMFLALCVVGFAIPFVPTLVLLLGTLAAFALYVLNVFLGKIPVAPMGFAGIFALLFALCYAVSAVIGNAFPASLEPMLMFLGLMCIIPVAARALEKKSRRDLFVTVLILSACIVSLHGIYQYIVGVPIDPAWVDKDNYAELTTRAYSTFGNPNVMGEYLIILASLSVGMFWKEKRVLWKAFYFCTTGVMGFGLLSTGSRGSMLGLAVSAAVFALIAEHRLLPFGAVAVAALPFVLPDSIMARFAGAITGTDSSTR
ncbi:MAG: murein biosynthesis integral membrane protein MurJ, partial [Oscillospiraceae bacterium]|nr:murein biosynthesis integral membrane protein MurJ [Oscillospiraceae bacterium]